MGRERTYGIGCILCAVITDADRHNILHRNAEALLRTQGVDLGGTTQ